METKALATVQWLQVILRRVACAFGWAEA